MMTDKLQVVTLITLHALINLFGSALIKAQINRSLPSQPIDYLMTLFSFRAIGGFFLIGSGFLIMMLIMRRSDFSFFMPVSLVVSYLITVVISLFFLGETIHLRTYVGLFFMLIGALALLR